MNGMSWFFILVGGLAFVFGAGGARRRDEERAERIWGFVAGVIIFLPLIWGQWTYQGDQTIRAWSDINGNIRIGPEQDPGIIVRLFGVAFWFLPAFYLAFCAPFLSRLMVAIWTAAERNAEDLIDRYKD